MKVLGHSEVVISKNEHGPPNRAVSPSLALRGFSFLMGVFANGQVSRSRILGLFLHSPPPLPDHQEQGNLSKVLVADAASHTSAVCW